MAIDIGTAAIDRAGYNGEATTFFTFDNPANATGTIDTVKVWAKNNVTNLRVGMFFLVSGTTYECRDSESVGGVTAGSEQTFTGLTISVETGDYIGYYCGADGTIEWDFSGGNGCAYVSGEYIDPEDQASYNVVDYDVSAMSINGTGESVLCLLPSAIPSAESFGTAQLNLKVVPSAISSAEAFGTPKLNLKLIPTGIASAEAFGTPTLGTFLSPSSIASEEAFGAPIIAGPILVTGIASGEQFGTPIVTPGGVIVAPTGISSEELFGLPKLNVFVTPSGIVTSEALGTAKLNLKLILSGIASAEAFGTPTVKMILVIRPSGIASVELFGTPLLIVILAGGDGMKLPTTKGQVSIPQRQVSIPSKEVSI